MGFGTYMRWDGWLAAAAGAALCAFGIAAGHEPPLDAVFGGLIMLCGTGIFMVVRHGAPFRQPGSWFTAKPLATATDALPPCRPRRLVVWMLGETAAFGILAVGLSYLTGFWITYMDVGVWAMATGAIKIGPAATMIAANEAREGITYRVARRPLRGLVELTGDRD
jgi:hypothetical protein